MHDAISGISPIETNYKGYRFRSRLEARWAVFFDALRIPWRYEEDGYTSGYGDTYLPDFRLYSRTWEGDEAPSNLFVEVKGSISQLHSDHERLVSLHDYGGCLPGFTHSMGTDTGGLILLGPIPEPGLSVHFHPIVQHYKGLWLSWCHFTAALGGPVQIVGADEVVAALFGLEPRSIDHPSDWALAAVSIAETPFLPHGYQEVQRAYAAARSARFEHGEKG